jgi:propionyl-CoA synthetase
MTSHYDDVYARSISDPEAFWAEAAKDIHWYRRWDTVLDQSNPPFYRWFAGAETNTCYNAVDRHVEQGRGDQAAIIYDSPLTDTIRHISYREFQDETARFGGVLRALGVEKGDRVLIYMPTIPQAAVAMLSCARIGAVHSVVFGGFASNELATRIDDAKPKVIVTASCGIEPNRVIPYMPLLNGAIDMADHKPSACLVLQREQETADMIAGRDVVFV